MSGRDPSAGHDTTLEYHQRLIADPHRVTLYDRALRALVRPGDRVLDAGAGTGLLAMLAARAGAGEVIAVESMGVAELARMLVAHNGLADRVEVVHADLRALPPREVDLIVSDCLGRFLVDDQMMDAMAAAFRWLAPGGRVIPARVELMVAPIGAHHLAILDTFARPTLGLDLRPAAALAAHATWGAAVGPEALLAPPAVFATWDLPGPAPTFAKDLAFALTPGRVDTLRGLAGWFRAELAPGVVLDTGPGLETHWHQLLMPLPATPIAAGDRLELHLALESMSPEPRWRRTGRVIQPGGERPFDLGGPHPEPAPRPRHLSPEGAAGLDADTLDELGGAAWEEGDHARALALFEDAVLALRADEDRPGLWENLGIARLAAGDPSAAIAPLLRALDGDLGAREQSLRLVVDACFGAGRHQDGAAFLAEYERRFGPHPAGWRREGT